MARSLICVAHRRAVYPCFSILSSFITNYDFSHSNRTGGNILKDLEQHTLDPVFEYYGNFIYIPTWEDEETAEKYKGLTAISGNFLTYSHAFRLLTDDTELIEELTTAIRKNQATEEYKQAKVRLSERKAEEQRRYLERVKGSAKGY